jgi:integron integrase
MRTHLRTRHYSIRTEQAYLDWARRFILFHGKRHPQEMGAAEVEAFLSHLAVDRQVSASTQNQAKAAILYLYKQVLEIQLPWLAEVVQAKQSRRLPVVLTPGEVRELLLHMNGTTGLIAQLLYGTGMRLLEALRLRVKDVEFARREIIVREGKGNKDRVTVLPENLMATLQAQLEKAQALHEKDLADGLGRVYLPHALAVKYPQADRSWAWQWVFPSPVRAIDPRPDARTGQQMERRHHVYPE